MGKHFVRNSKRLSKNKAVRCCTKLGENAEVKKNGTTYVIRGLHLEYIMAYTHNGILFQ